MNSWYYLDYNVPLQPFSNLENAPKIAKSWILQQLFFHHFLRPRFMRSSYVSVSNFYRINLKPLSWKKIAADKLIVNLIFITRLRPKCNPLSWFSLWILCSFLMTWLMYTDFVALEVLNPFLKRARDIWLRAKNYVFRISIKAKFGDDNFQYPSHSVIRLISPQSSLLSK